MRPSIMRDKASTKATDLPVEIWSIIMQDMPPKDWRKARGFCRATNALRRPSLAAQIPGYHQVDVRQLQLDQWSACHSLYLKLGQHYEAQRSALDQLQIHLKLTGSKLPMLRCVHIIGQTLLPLTESSVEGILLSHLARHDASLLMLTLQIRTLMMPLDFPRLQHLALDLGSEHKEWATGQSHLEVFPAIRMLKVLKTLYIQSSTAIVHGPADLICCVHLQCVAVQGVSFRGMLCLPPSCLLHAKVQVEHLHASMNNVNHRVNGLTLQSVEALLRIRDRMRKGSEWPFWPESLWFPAPSTQCLSRLRIFLDKEAFEKNPSIWFDGSSAQQEMLFGVDKTPSLEVVEMDVHCDLTVSIDPKLPLKVLVLIATGSLQLRTFRAFELLPASMPTLEKMYVQWGTSILPGYRPAAEPSHAADPESWTGVRLEQYVKEGQDHWTAQMPVDFEPGDLQECCCGACLPCLAQASVPVLCDQAWTSEGFEQHLGPHCRQSLGKLYMSKL